ncbi:MAG TPA: hypothetical protein VI546_04865, partial [candidate division Zixibacteria bacterium]|nr:hypothetical protein [candidate division Zixibacteria bacterium]
LRGNEKDDVRAVADSVTQQKPLSKEGGFFMLSFLDKSFLLDKLAHSQGEEKCARKAVKISFSLRNR